ncbi:MAG: hypothetical protein O3A46_15035 [Candidatus Poribacteria bacterium]|nr:hypothetical protein [Candidatus Poribacteria bacterium]
MFALRQRRHLILLAYLGVAIVLMLIHPMFAVVVVPLILTSFRNGLYRLFFSQTNCPTCGKTVPLVGSWRCGGCGFVQHRHAFQPCAKCGLGVGELPCPHCEHGMFL